jgi:hypothetical protein
MSQHPFSTITQTFKTTKNYKKQPTTPEHTVESSAVHIKPTFSKHISPPPSLGYKNPALSDEEYSNILREYVNSTGRLPSGPEKLKLGLLVASLFTTTLSFFLSFQSF